MNKHTKVIVSIFLIIMNSFLYAAKVISLGPNQSEQLTNSYFWTLNATCNVQTNQLKANKIRVTILKNQGRVNGKLLTAGQATSVSIKNNQNISVSAEPGTEVNLSNLSGNPIKATCTT
ncbi:MAG: hypothetical protein ACOVQX_07065 [Legionella sp.]